MDYCKRCVYPANTQPHIIFDNDGICSGCRVYESRNQIEWGERRKQLDELLEEYRERAKGNDSQYDCIIPVSGGKDSHYQTYVITEEYDLNPLLVTYNHTYNTRIGLRNLRNLVDKSGADLLRYTSSRESVRKITHYMLRKTGDVTWNYHAGIMTFPIQAAVMYDIPLIVWGESGYRYKMGMYNPDDMVEFTQKERQEHDMRGFEPQNVVEDPDSEQWGLTRQDLVPFEYPTDEEIEEVGVRGIYLDNFMEWDAHAQTKQMIDEWDFATWPLGYHQSDRTFLNYSEIDDAANGTHDYLRYLKYGYGRATDHATREIRHGRMTREEGVELVERYDHNRPRDLDFFLEFLDMSESEFEKAIEDMRDTDVWEQDSSGNWHLTDSVGNHRDDPGVEEARPPETEGHWTDISNPITDYEDEDFVIF